MGSLLKYTEKNFITALLLVFGITILSIGLSYLPFFKHLHFSPLAIGILLGVLYGGTLKKTYSKNHAEGFSFCAKTLLRVGVVLYGFKITIQDVIFIGYEGIVMAAVIVFGVFYISYFFGTRLLKIDKETSILTACGSSVCGAAAVLGAEATLGSKSHKTAVAIGTVVVFGTLFMFLIPLAYRLGIFDWMSVKELGIFIGASTHEVAHVVGAASAVNADTQIYAVIEKMIRVIMLVPLLFLLPFMVKNTETGGKKNIRPPAFAIWFIVVIAINSLIPFSENLLFFIEQADTILLTMAMTALGVEIDLKKLRETGLKPFLQAIFSALLLIAVPLLIIYILQ